MASLTVPYWVVLVGKVSSVAAAWVALIWTGWREWRERTHLKFRFTAGIHEDYDDENGEWSENAVGVTVSSMGVRPIALNGVICGGLSRGADGPEAREWRASFKRAKVAQGEPAYEKVIIFGEAIEFTDVRAVDTTGKVRKATKKEVRQLNAVFKQRFLKEPVRQSNRLKGKSKT